MVVYLSPHRPHYQTIPPHPNSSPSSRLDPDLQLARLPRTQVRCSVPAWPTLLRRACWTSTRLCSSQANCQYAYRVGDQQRTRLPAPGAFPCASDRITGVREAHTSGLIPRPRSIVAAALRPRRRMLARLYACAAHAAPTSVSMARYSFGQYLYDRREPAWSLAAFPRI